MSQWRVQLLGDHATTKRDLTCGNQLEQFQGGKRRVAIKGIVEQSQRQAPHLLDGESAARQWNRPQSGQSLKMREIGQQDLTPQAVPSLPNPVPS